MSNDNSTQDSEPFIAGLEAEEDEEPKQTGIGELQPWEVETKSMSLYASIYSPHKRFFSQSITQDNPLSSQSIPQDTPLSSPPKTASSPFRLVLPINKLIKHQEFFIHSPKKSQNYAKNASLVSSPKNRFQLHSNSQLIENQSTCEDDDGIKLKPSSRNLHITINSRFEKKSAHQENEKSKIFQLVSKSATYTPKSSESGKDKFSFSSIPTQHLLIGINTHPRKGTKSQNQSDLDSILPQKTKLFTMRSGFKASFPLSPQKHVKSAQSMGKTFPNLRAFFDTYVDQRQKDLQPARPMTVPSDNMKKQVETRIRRVETRIRRFDPRRSLQRGPLDA